MAKAPLFTFAIITDTHIRPGELDESSPFPVNDLANDRARYAIASIASHNPAFVMHLGDMVHPLPHLPTYESACAEAYDIFTPVRDLLRFVPGNHDIGDKPMPDSPAGPSDAAAIAKYEAAFGPGHYSFEHNGCRFVTINSSLVNSASEHEAQQRAWLEDVLTGARGQRIFLCSHYPPFINTTDESSHYDNYSEPGRSWMVDLIAKHDIEAVFSGHVHQFFYNRVGAAKLYCLPPTSFIRQDYAELYRVEPASEYGRNDTGKFSYALVDVFDDGHRLRVTPTDGAGLAQGQSLPLDAAAWSERPSTPLTLHLRHAWAEAVDLPYNGPMEEFSRKRARNDYTLLRLQQMGISRVRVPLADLVEERIRERMNDYHAAGMRFSVFSVGVPDDTALEVLVRNIGLIEQLEIVSCTSDLSDVAGQLQQLSGLSDIAVMIGKSHSSKHEPEQGSKFAHAVSYGFKWEERDVVLDALDGAAVDDGTFGVVFQVNLSDDLAQRIGEIEALGGARNRRMAANVRLADANPAVANFDDAAIAARVIEAVGVARELEHTEVQLDTFVDVDRGYNPRHGLLDRRYNFRPAGRALAQQ